VQYKLEVNRKPIALEVEIQGDNRFTALIDGKNHQTRYAKISDNTIQLTVDGRQTMAFVADTPEGKAIMVDGRVWLIEDAAAPRNRRKGGPSKEPTDVSPPMPAVVTKIMVAVGDTVVKGQGVVVVSAMKMDMILSAPYDGVVERINAAEGEKVAPTQVLVDIGRS
jgi:acetyl-CoA/propionyl-CoA carboxylase, biotin carboxylase, biotin carboxyl carrier protein